MPLLGAHMSIAGGYYRAIEAAAKLKMEACQIFTKNNNQWQGKAISQADIDAFRSALDQGSVRHTLSHSSYLINLAAPDQALWTKSIDAMVDELVRADRLGVPHVVVHPGAYTTTSETVGLERISAALTEIARQTKSLTTNILLETTAGQGSTLGWRFEQLAELLQRSPRSGFLAVCVDTCHVFAAGYPIHTPDGYDQTMTEFDRIIGLDQIAAFHLNDSQRELGSRVDRHDHIGEGKIGKEAFRRLLNDPRFATVPMYLETPKEDPDGRDMDRLNLQRLRRLAIPTQQKLKKR